MASNYQSLLRTSFPSSSFVLVTCKDKVTAIVNSFLVIWFYIEGIKSVLNTEDYFIRTFHFSL